MRAIAQPGAPLQPRLIACPVEAKSLRLHLPAGVNLLRAVTEAFAARGYASGVADIHGLRLDPLFYVMPALSKTAEHAAFYSEIFRPVGATIIESGALTFGRREAAPFFHAHAIWCEADGRVSGGHILPDDTVLADDATVEAVGICGAAFESLYDAETNFTLFGPVPGEAEPAHPEAYAIRLRPNEDICTALESFCIENKIGHARLRGGVGSIIGAHFADGRVVENFATEVFIRQGDIMRRNGAMVADVEIGLVDYTGALASGTLRRGDNPVLMTFELVLDIIARG